MKKFIENILHPTKVFIAILVVVIIWFVPIAFPPNIAEQTPLQQSLPVLKIFASSADACPFACVKCTAWDPNAWPKNCLEYVCLADCEEELPPPTQPPVISHTLNCPLNGNNGWCKGNLSLDLTASDPQNAQVIISGTINGIAFACPTGNTTCSIPLSDGQGNITYRVDSSTGLSDSDSTTYKKDSTTPQINGSVSGANGLNNWYVSSAILSATSTDTTSGISSFEMNINNTGWINYAETTFTDGIHTIQYRATDNAGNVTETAVQEIKVDTATPVINISKTGTLGQSNWYTSNVILSATTNDITSGIFTFEINIDNTGWATYDLQPVTLTDGIHTIQYRATDNAGNTYTTTEQQIKVDTTTPSLSLSTTGTKGQNDWYVSRTNITPTATDTGSGIASIEHKLNNGAFNLYTSPLQFSDGIHTYQFKITDNAGNITTTPSLTLKVDTIAPIVDMDDEIDLGDKLYYELQDAGSGLWINRTVIEDEDEKYKKVVWLEEIFGYKIEGDILWDGKFKDGTTAPVGEYFITLKISDQAGNETFSTTVVNVNPLSFLQVIPEFIPPASDEIVNNESTSEELNSFGNENNGNPSTETSSTNVGGEIVFANAIAQAGTLTSFTSGNENTSTPITNTDILWGAMATAIVGATLAEWQRKREEEEARQREADRIAQMEKNAERKAEKARLDYLNAAYQAKLDREKAKQIAVSAACWNGIAQIEQAKEKAKQVASQNTFNHLMNEHKSQTGVYVSKPNTGGSKPLTKPVPQDPNPPEEKPWWEKVTEWWNNLLNSNSKTEVAPTQTLILTTTATPTITILPSATSTPGQPKIYAIDGPMSIDQIPQEFRCTLPEYKIINGQELRNVYYNRCKDGEQIMVRLLTDPNGWWWKDGYTQWDNNGNIVTTNWVGVKTNEDFWRLALAYGLDTEGTTLRRDNVNGYRPLIEQAIINKFWHFDHGVSPLYGTEDSRSGIPDPNDSSPLGTNGRLVALGSLESLEIRKDIGLYPPKDGGSTNMWMESWNTYSNLFANEPTWIEPPATAPYEVGNINPNHPYYKSDNVAEGVGEFEVLYRSSPNAASVRAIVLTFEQFTDVYSQLPK